MTIERRVAIFGILPVGGTKEMMPGDHFQATRNGSSQVQEWIVSSDGNTILEASGHQRNSLGGTRKQ